MEKLHYKYLQPSSNCKGDTQVFMAEPSGMGVELKWSDEG